MNHFTSIINKKPVDNCLPGVLNDHVVNINCLKGLFYLVLFSALCLPAIADNTKNKSFPGAILGKLEGDTYFSNRQEQAPLNVVYFVPTDLVEKFENNKAQLLHNVSNAMLYAQKWYAVQMDHNGYGMKTFSLNVNNRNEVMIVVIYGKRSSKEYAKTKEVKLEIEDFFKHEPQYKGGSHFVVLTDSASGFHNEANGHMAFHRSSDNYTMRASGKFIGDFELMNCGICGGLLHEMGHAFNATHMAHVASNGDMRSIMGGGGANLYNNGGKEDKVLVLPTSAAAFNTSEAFNLSNNGIKYYDKKPVIELLDYSIKKNDALKSTEANFTFRSDVKPTNLYVCYDAFPTKVNDDYDKVSFLTAVQPTNVAGVYSASLSIPYTEYFNGFQDNIKTNNLISLSVTVLTENGFRTELLKYNYTISHVPVPDDNINRNYTTSVK